MRQGLLKEQDIEICPIMEGVELLLVDGKEIGRYLLITYVGWIANNDVERTDVSNQEIRLTDITVKRKGGEAISAIRLRHVAIFASSKSYANTLL